MRWSLPAGRLVVADETVALGLLFGELAQGLRGGRAHPRADPVRGAGRGRADAVPGGGAVERSQRSGTRSLADPPSAGTGKIAGRRGHWRSASSAADHRAHRSGLDLGYGRASCQTRTAGADRQSSSVSSRSSSSTDSRISPHRHAPARSASAIESPGCGVSTRTWASWSVRATSWRDGCSWRGGPAPSESSWRRARASCWSG